MTTNYYINRLFKLHKQNPDMEIIFETKVETDTISSYIFQKIVNVEIVYWYYCKKTKKNFKDEQIYKYFREKFDKDYYWKCLDYQEINRKIEELKKQGKITKKILGTTGFF